MEPPRVLDYSPADNSSYRWMMFRRIGGILAAGILAVIGLGLLAMSGYAVWELIAASGQPDIRIIVFYSICGIGLTVLSVKLLLASLRSKARAVRDR
ncbi:MAG TPA: hypothetical protein VIM11_09680 [Tepidisphaeraceae bacterium]